MSERALKPGRIPCLNPRCGRTAAQEKYPDCKTIVCGKCWRALPRPLRARHTDLCRREKRLLRKVERRVAAGTIDGATVERIRDKMFSMLNDNWADIERYFTVPERPVGLEEFLQHMGLQ